MVVTAAVAGAAVTTPGSSFAATGDSTLFTTQIPKILADTDTASVELGVRFKASTAGQVVGVRFYKGTGNTGPHVGSLWNAAGTRLAGATFTNETSSGWQQVTFAAPVTVTAGQEYVASYHANQGRYSADVGYFASSRTSGALTTPPSAGVYRYGSSVAFPRNTYYNTNYWVDVVFRPSTSLVTAPAPTTSAAPSPTPTATTSPSPTATTTAAPTATSSPTTPPAAPTGTLAPGVVPGPGQVGFLGDPRTLRVIDSAATAPAGTTWTNGYLTVNADNVTLDGVWVKGGIDYYGRGTLTVKNSIVEGGGSWFIVMGRNSGARMDVSDTTLRWRPGSVAPQGAGSGAIHGNTYVNAVRNDISGTPDGIQNGPGNSLFQQNYIHDLAVLGTYPNNTHNDGIQFYGGSNIRVLHNRIDIGWNGTNQNAALFFQGNFSSPVIEGNYLSGGGFTLRLESGVSSAVVRKNTFKLPTISNPPYTPGTHLIQGGVAEWSGNQMASGTVLNR